MSRWQLMEWPDFLSIYLPYLVTRGDEQACIQTESKMTNELKSFCSEKCYAIEPSAIPRHAYNPGGERETPSLDYIFGEMIREDPKYTKHIDKPIKPTRIHGLAPERLRELEAELIEGASRETETYTRRGKTHTRAQRKTTPILLVMIAHWPEPGGMEPTPKRERWVRRVVRLAKSRFGSMLKCVLAHTDESAHHLHIVVANGGKPMKPNSAGHNWAMDLLARNPKATRKELMAEHRAGLSAMQQWFHRWAGETFGHIRSQTPRKRMPKREALIGQKKMLDDAEEKLAAHKKAIAAALRERKEKLEAEEREIQRRAQAVAEAEAHILEQAAMLKEALARLHQREAKVNTMRAAVVDQLAVEQVVAKNRYEAPGIF